MIKLTTNFGDITLELSSDKAPETVQNFLNYVTSGFYDNTIFHRVIDDFMVQGGGYEPGMKQKQTGFSTTKSLPHKDLDIVFLAKLLEDRTWLIKSGK